MKMIKVPCPICGGRKYLIIEAAAYIKKKQNGEKIVPCRLCGGSGYIIEHDPPGIR
jgi:hypothetical protein